MQGRLAYFRLLSVSASLSVINRAGAAEPAVDSPLQ